MVEAPRDQHRITFGLEQRQGFFQIGTRGGVLTEQQRVVRQVAERTCDFPALTDLPAGFERLLVIPAGTGKIAGELAMHAE